MIFWYCTVVSTYIVCDPRCCIVISSSFTLYPASPESYNLIVYIFLHVLTIRNIQNFMYL